MSRLEYANRQQAKTVIELRIQSSGRMKKWYGERLGYAFKCTASQKRRGKPGSQVSAFYDVASGKKVPKKPERRVKLASLLGCSCSELWKLDDRTGKLRAIRVGET